jgi:DUF4097 and DUF4098 domain-containing protein YvlB
MTPSTPLDFAGITTLEASTFNGWVRVSVAEADHGFTETREGNVDVILTRSGDTLRIEAKSLEQPCRRCKVDLKLLVPAGLTLKLSSGNGDVQCEGAAAAITASSGNGDVSVTRAFDGRFKLQSGNGNVTLSEASGAVEAKSGNGLVRLENVLFASDSSHSARSGNGGIQIVDPRAAQGLVIDGSTGNGGLSIKLEGFAVAQRKTITGGSFHAEAPGENPARLELNTGNGSIMVRQ